MLLYLHIPFCHRVCPYCSFYKHTPGDTPIGEFIDALLAEARHRIADLPEKPRTLYLGGGTPSMLSPTHLRKLFGGLAELLDLSSLDEVTLEANPATFDVAKARIFRELGVTRISLGIQSFAPHVLKTLGREHDPAQAAEAVHTLRDAEMPVVNIDLMFSIPGLSLDDWRATLQSAIDLRPDHISAYNLTYEEDTAFFDGLRRGDLDADEDRDASQFLLAHELLTAAGFEHYETSNYARPDHRSSHNRGYWRGEDYLGLGPSAVSTVGNIRVKNIPDTAGYVRMVNSLGHATVESEALDAEQRRLERLALMLRTDEGIPLSLADPAAIQGLLDHHLAEIRGENLVLTLAGSPLVDPIAAELA
ncbi:MAG: radical SAM family heme chaperone HemW [Verrucomicrobia bacterium]|nr:MAG: radical SAM family heme chaperone HemW [Verrucomicrobiota bacterium]TAE87873.1 MAG: radical SAM family heme chaperone HemW [Verrucomicrobiota bacterium]TAF25616.1 MAG: radical SAM family heme chaperone HemW [Verrucomicrobiota bacterium]TAF41318.1 MAG: radical SAM family heme chaperone HemW [Verrucomicrobiota bacterium]